MNRDPGLKSSRMRLRAVGGPTAQSLVPNAIRLGALATTSSSALHDTYLLANAEGSRQRDLTRECPQADVLQGCEAPGTCHRQRLDIDVVPPHFGRITAVQSGTLLKRCRAAKDRAWAPRESIISARCAGDGSASRS